MKIFIVILLFLPLLIQADINNYAQECKIGYLKESLDTSAVESRCKNVNRGVKIGSIKAA